MRKPITLAMAALALELCQPVIAQQKANDAKGSNAQLEASFDQQLSSTHIGATIKQLSAKPHHLGAAEGKAVAETVLEQFKSYGWDARIETYQVLFPTPKTRVLE